MANGYDSLNRLVSAQATAGSSYSGLQASWSYDSFGNRLTEAFGGTDTGSAPVPPGTSLAYNANNRITGVSSGSPPAYDSSGNVVCDSYNAGTGQCVVTASTNQYLYDGEGRLCAAATASGMFGYLYDAEGTRIAKGTITTFSCDTSINQSTGQPNNGFSMTTSYILGLGNEQLTELNWSGGVATPAHTNVFAAGQLVATYSFNNDPNASSPGTVYFHITDWLGTRRALADYTGELQQTCDSLPFGNGEDCATLPTEHLFTGKERDAESGNDYFGARYYASTMGRFMSPDPFIPFNLKKDEFQAWIANPQHWNKYAYAPNNGPKPQPQPQKRQCSGFEQLSYAWHGVETIGMVGVGAGLAVTGVLGEIAACTAGSPLLCVAATPGAAAAVYVGYKITTTSWKALATPNNPEFGADCQ